MTRWRVICGIVWAGWMVAFGIGAVLNLVNGHIPDFLVGAVLAGLAAWYDYRIWTLKARRLTLFMIF